MKLKTALQTSFWYMIAIVAVFGGSLLVTLGLRLSLSIDVPLWMPALVIAGLVIALTTKNYLDKSMNTDILLAKLNEIELKIEGVNRNTEQIKKAIEE